VPLRIDLENPERESGLALDPLDEPSFLPVGMFPASEGEQDLVWANARTWSWTAVMGVSSPTAPPTTLAPLGTSCPRIVSRLRRPRGVPGRCPTSPLDSSGERWRNDEDLFGRFDHGSNVVGQLVQVGYRCAGEHQQAIDV
jgi:hypothetical protein